jgi:chemotaxis protein histidine kinase CheA/CheY-like chemotaxis protein
MLSEQQQRIMGYFIEEAKDHLNTIEQGLLNLQSTIADPEMVNEMFRAAHSVKGGAAMLGLNGIQQTSHRLEDYFKVLKECPIQVDQKLETLFLRVFDTLQELLEHLQGPFGLTDDKAEEVMSDVMPVFTALNEHLGRLVSQCGATPPEDVDLGLEQPVTAAAAPAAPARTQPVSEESALRLVFQSDVPAQLREMLGLFKQVDQAASREQLQSVCRNLAQAGEQFELSNWCELLELARRAIAHSDNSYRTLAPIVIKDIKQAQELVLSGRSVEICCSENLRALLPAEPAEALDDFADLLASVDFDRSDSDLELSDFALDANDAPLTAAESTESDNLFDQDDSWFTEATYSESTYVDESTFIRESTFIQQEGTFSDADLGFGEPAPENGDLGANLNLGQSHHPSRFADHTGPEVGAAELNSLADLFEGEVPDLGMTWQEEVVIVDTVGDFPDALDADAASDFSDLLFDQDALDDDLSLQTEIQEDDDLSGLLSSSELFGDSSDLSESSPLTQLGDLMNEMPQQSEDELLANLNAETTDSELSLDFLESEFENSEGSSEANPFADVELDEPDAQSSLPKTGDDLENLTELFADLDEDFTAEPSSPFSLNELDQAFTVEEPEPQQPEQEFEPFAQLPDPFLDEDELLESPPTDRADDLVLELDDVDLSGFETDDFSVDAMEEGDPLQASLQDLPSSDSLDAEAAQDWEVLQDSSGDDSLIDAFLHDDAPVTAAAQPSEDFLIEEDLPLEEELLLDTETSIETLADDASLFVSEPEAELAPTPEVPSTAPTASSVADPWDEEFEEFNQSQAQPSSIHDFDSDDDFFDSFSGVAVPQGAKPQNQADTDLFADPFDDPVPSQPVTPSQVAAPTTPQAEPGLGLDVNEAIAAFEDEAGLESMALADSPAPAAVTEDLLVEGFVIDLSESEDELVSEPSESSNFVEGFASDSSDFVEGFVFDSFDAEEAPSEAFDGLFEPEPDLAAESFGLTASPIDQPPVEEPEGLFGAEDEAIAPSPTSDSSLIFDSDSGSDSDTAFDNLFEDNLFEPEITESLELAALDLAAEEDTFSNLFGEDDDAALSDLSAPSSEVDQALFDSEPVEAALEPQGFSENLFDSEDTTGLDLDLTETAVDLDFDLGAGTAETAETADFNLDTEETEDLGFNLNAESDSDLDFNLDAESTEDLGFSLDAESTEDLGFSLDAESTEDLGFSLDAEETEDLSFSLNEDSSDLDFNLDTESTSDLDFNLDTESTSDLDFNLDAESTPVLDLNLETEGTEDLDFSLNEDASNDLDFNLEAGGAEDLDFNLDAEITQSSESEALDEAMFSFDTDAVDAQEQDFSAMFGEESELVEAETPAVEDQALDEAFGFDEMNVGEDANILNEEAFDFDLFGAEEELSEPAIAPSDAIALDDLTDTSASDSSDLDISDLSFGSETDLEEIAGIPETSEGSEADVLPDLNSSQESVGMTEADDFADADATEEAIAERYPQEVALDAELDAIESDDFADLDALLEESTESSASVTASAAEPLQDDFADLDALLEDQVAEPISLDFDASSSEAVDDFANLDALLGDDFAATSPSVDSANQAIEAIDEFDDLERLLEDADQTLGGPPTSKNARRPALAPNRRSNRRGGGVLSDQTMRVSVKNLDNLNNLVGELVVNRNSLEQGQERLRQFLDNLLYQVQQLSDVGQRMRDLYERSLLESSLLSSRKSYQLSPPGNGGSALIQSSHSTGLSFDALEMDRFTGFHTLSQEMIELIVRVRESASDIDFVVDETDQVTRMFRQVTTQLQEGLTRSRMVPFAQTADRLPRAVRDISLKCGKQAELTVEGRETLIDKMILEQLYDPMTHLVNNAITHGIETPEERIAARKPPVGRITVRTFHQGNQTVISVTDDGAGINPQKVKAKALEKGLITPAESREMTELDVYDLLFHHGFSTKDRADDLSGRGIGMDVVRTSLNEIRGVINIDSTVGKGTTFTIRLPLTLSISKALCCISNRARIAFPMDGVEDMLDVPKERIQTDSEGRSCILWRDTLLPFQPLSELLKYNRSLGRGSVYGGNQEEDIVSVVVLRSAGNFLALQVDQVLGEQEIVIKQLEGPVPKPVGVAGATVLGDGRIMPIADVLELIDLSVGRIRREAGNALWEKEQEPPVEAPVIKTDPTVLIVDDSITVRELLSMTFNKVGYRVEQARDGQEAWEKLRSGLPCDLVFCDIEMPRMDGLELLSRIQKDPNLEHLPIAMLTSRGADRHRQMAVQLGAKGYFTKPYLEEALLDAAQRMLKGEVLVSGDS